MQPTVQMVKMSGIGNEILVIDMRPDALPQQHEAILGQKQWQKQKTVTDRLQKQAVLALARAPETAFDQIMAIYPPRSEAVDYYIEIWNRDGSHAGACGNGTRCVVDYLHKKEQKTAFMLETDGGFIAAHILEGGEISVDMGQPAFDWKKIPTSHSVEDTLHVSFGKTSLQDGSLVSMGNPHAIFFVEVDIHAIKLEEYGPILEHDPLFPEQANISIARILAPNALEMRTWERGVGLTLACGSAACATTVAACRRGLTGRVVRVRQPGGSLHIEWRASDGHVLMRGGVVVEFSGLLDPLTGIFKRDQSFL